jgi:hypothetical protein
LLYLLLISVWSARCGIGRGDAEALLSMLEVGKALREAVLIVSERIEPEFAKE